MALRRKDNFELEQGWDNKVNLQPLSLKSASSRQHVITSNERANSNQLNHLSNMKPFPAPHVDPGVAVNDRENAKPIHQGPILSSALSSITTKLDFIHHVGTDHEKELDVINCILLRESIILKLKNLCNEITHHDKVTHSPFDSESELLDTLSLMRSTTTNYIECICTWRESDAKLGQHNLRKFLWEGENYTLKITRDLDFLADQPLLVSALKLPAEKIKANPLMLPNNLEEADTWMKPKQRAIHDSGGLSEGAFFEERLRVRNAERVLLMELEIYSNVQTPEWDVECNDVTKGSDSAVGESQTIILDKEQKNNDGPSSLPLTAHKQIKSSSKRSSSSGTGSNLRLNSGMNPNSPKMLGPSSHTNGQSDVVLGPLLAGSKGTGVGGKRADFTTLMSKKGVRTKGRTEGPLSSLATTGPFGSYSQPLSIRQNKTLKSLSADSGGGGIRRQEGDPRSPSGGAGEAAREGFSVSKNGETPAVQLTSEDMERVASMQTLPPRLVLATAAVVLLIGLHGGTDKTPQDTPLAAFRELAKQPKELSQNLNELHPALVNKSKVKALLPYMSSLAGEVYPGFNLSEKEVDTGNRLCNRIVQLVVQSSRYSPKKPKKKNKIPNRVSGNTSNFTYLLQNKVRSNPQLPRLLPTAQRLSARSRSFKQDIKLTSAEQDADWRTAKRDKDGEDKQKEKEKEKEKEIRNEDSEVEADEDDYSNEKYEDCSDDIDTHTQGNQQGNQETVDSSNLKENEKEVEKEGEREKEVEKENKNSGYASRLRSSVGPSVFSFTDDASSSSSITPSQDNDSPKSEIFLSKKLSGKIKSRSGKSRNLSTTQNYDFGLPPDTAVIDDGGNYLPSGYNPLGSCQIVSLGDVQAVESQCKDAPLHAEDAHLEPHISHDTLRTDQDTMLDNRETTPSNAISPPSFPTYCLSPDLPVLMQSGNIHSAKASASTNVAEQGLSTFSPASTLPSGLVPTYCLSPALPLSAQRISSNSLTPTTPSPTLLPTSSPVSSIKPSTFSSDATPVTSPLHHHSSALSNSFSPNRDLLLTPSPAIRALSAAEHNLSHPRIPSPTNPTLTKCASAFMLRASRTSSGIKRPKSASYPSRSSQKDTAIARLSMTGNLADRRRKSSDKSSLTEKDSNLFTSQDTDSSRDLACALFTDESLIVLEDDEFTTSAVEKHAVCGIAEMPYKAPLNDSKEDQVTETEQSVELVLVDDVVGMTSDLSLEDSPSYYSPGTPTDVDEQSEGDSVARIAEASDSVEDVQDSMRVSPTAMCKQDQLDGEEVEGDAGSPDRAQASSVEVKEKQAHALVKDGVPVLVTASGRVVESESTSEQAHTQAEEEEMKDEKEIEVGSTIAVNRLD